MIPLTRKMDTSEVFYFRLMCVAPPIVVGEWSMAILCIEYCKYTKQGFRAAKCDLLFLGILISCYLR